MSKEDQKRVVKSTKKSVFLPLGDAHSCAPPLVEKNRENLEATLGPEALIQSALRVYLKRQKHADQETLKSNVEAFFKFALGRIADTKSL